MPAEQYGMNDDQLVQIINHTSNACQQIKQVESIVTAQVNPYRVANNSQSGKLVGETLDEWTSECAQIEAALDQLNQKVAAMRQVNRSAEENTTSIASHGSHGSGTHGSG
jgi:hypothetical protein